MQTRSISRWLMIVSTAIAVLPVCRSPMISSRWPRPIGIIESIAFSPVCTGSRTGWRATTPGAIRSIGAKRSVRTGPLPSIGCPSGFTTRPSSSSPTGTEMMRPVRLTRSPSLIFPNSPSSTAPTLSSSRFSAMPNTLWPKSSISPAMARSIPCTRAIPSPSETTLPTSATSTSTAKLPICSRMTLEISSALMFMAVDELSGSSGELLSDPFELPPQAAIVDGAANSGDDAAQNLGLDSRRHHNLPPGQGAEPLPDCSQAVAVQRHGRRHLGANDLAVIQEPPPILLEHLPRQRQAIAFGEQLQELPDHWLDAHLRGQGCHQR